MTEGKTLNGIPTAEIPQAMIRPLAPNAFKRHPTKGFLTTIDSAFTRERLTEVFGTYGVGWGLTWEPENTERWTTETSKGKTWHHFALLQAFFWFNIGDEKIVYPVTGYGNNDNLGDAMEGAQTNAINLAAKRLLFQLHIYKDAPPEQGSLAAKPQPNGKPKLERPMSPQQLKQAAKVKTAKFTKAAKDNQRQYAVSSLSKACDSDEDLRHAIGDYLFGKESSADWTSGECSFVIEWIGANEANDYTPTDEAMTEVKALSAIFVSQQEGDGIPF